MAAAIQEPLLPPLHGAVWTSQEDLNSRGWGGCGSGGSRGNGQMGSTVGSGVEGGKVLGVDSALIKLEQDKLKLRIRKRPTDGGGPRKGPMLVKHPSTHQLDAETPNTERTPKFVSRRACRTPSPTESRRSSSPAKRSSSPPITRGRGGGGRTTSPASSHGQQPQPEQPSSRRPSPARSRPSSPSSGGTRRLPSPSGQHLDAAALEALQRRIRRAQRARLYLLQQPGPHSFLVGGDSPAHKYKVIVGPQTCSCGRGPSCVHVLFIMLRVFQVPDNDHLLTSKQLKNFEVESLFQQYKARRSSRISQKQVATPELEKEADQKLSSTSEVILGSSSSPPGDKSSEEDVCPICLLEMVEGDSLVSCKLGCHNKLHHHCISVWAGERRRQGDAVDCPLCRAPWVEEDQQEEIDPSSNLNSSPQNVPDSSGLAPPLPPLTPSPLPSPSATSPPPRVPTPPVPFTIPTPTRHKPPNQSPAPSCNGHSRRRGSRERNGCAREPQKGYSPCYFPTSGPIRAPAPSNAGKHSNQRQHRPVHAFSVLPDKIILPHAEPIPDEHMHTAGSWIKVFGADLVACLFSRDWVVRETALRRLTHEVTSVLHYESTYNFEERSEKVIRSCANILAMLASDPVYKVYLGCLRCLRALLAYTDCQSQQEVQELQSLMRPIVRTVILKCVDGNRKTSQLSVECLLELARGQSGEMALGKHSVRQSSSTKVGGNDLGGVEFALGCILEDYNAERVTWQWLLGRLVVLDQLLEGFSEEFALRYVMQDGGGCKLANYGRLMSVIEFAFRALRSSHATVAKLARRVFVQAAKLTAVEPCVYKQVCEMLSMLDIALQLRLRRRLLIVVEGHHHHHTPWTKHGRSEVSPCLLDSPTPPPPHSTSTNRTLLRSLSHSPSRNNAWANREQPVRPTHLPLDGSRYSPRKQKRAEEWAPWANGSSGSAHTPRADSPTPLIRPERHLWGKYDDTGYVEVSKPCFRGKVTTPDTPSAPHTTPVADTYEDHDLVEEEDKVPLPFIPQLTSTENSDEELINLQEENMEGETPAGVYVEGIHWMKGPLLGTGAFSACYQARDVRTGALMAVKEVPIKRNTTEEQERAEAALAKELSVMHRLRHPNVVRVLGAGKSGDSFHLFVEWMPGGSVAGLLDRYGAFSEPVILRYTRQVLCGLAYLHRRHVLHRDLKGGNLLVDATGHHLRIADFGAATRLASQATVSGEFQGQLLGTIAFMAPEVLRGEDYGRSCDVWSVGCCIIEMATTKPPWNALDVSNHLALIFKIACSTLPPPIPPSLSPVACDLALTCLRVNPDQRPTAKELLLHPAFDEKVT